MCLGGIDVDADGCIKIRNSECNAYGYKVSCILSIFEDRGWENAPGI